uniref:SHOCT domain-containing protein n=2 Tax=Niallia circulans TaxID=1397 RepID=A0A941GDC6_NIACI|nr:SHOCT domain-containing protein [Niallia circulans]
MIQKQDSIQNENFDAVNEIRKFKELLDDGIITEDEFEDKKKQLLGL